MRKLARGGGVAPRAEPKCQGARERSTVACAGAGLQLSPSASPALSPGAPSARTGGAASPPSVPAALAGRPRFPAAPSNPPTPLWSSPPGPCTPSRVRGCDGTRSESAPKCLLRLGSGKQRTGGPTELWRPVSWSAHRAPGAGRRSCWGSPAGAKAAAVPRGRVLAIHFPPRGAARPRGPPRTCQLRVRGAWTTSGLSQVDVVRSGSQVEGERHVGQKLRERWGQPAA